MRPGDLLLFAETKPDWISQSIQLTQEELGYRADDARWTHAATYIGDKESICEATFTSLLNGRVRQTRIADYIGAHLLRARRNPSLGPNEQWRIAVEALTWLGQSYAFADVLKIGYHAISYGLFPVRRRPRLGGARSRFCSQLYAEAYMRATKTLLDGCLPAETYPATLSATGDLQDVALRWVPLQPPGGSAGKALPQTPAPNTAPALQP